MGEDQPALILCMENSSGQEVALRIEPTDDFRTFLEKANSLLGFEVDINSVTKNQSVALTDNIYQFLLTADHGLNSHVDLATQTLQQILEPTDGSKDLVYILDDGTQINASQIHFDNEDIQLDLTAESIPFVKYTNDADSDVETVAEDATVKYSIIDSPVPKWTDKANSTQCSFINSLPFKLVCNNTSGFEAQFTKYLETNAKTYTTLSPVTVKDKSPRTLIRDNYKSFETKTEDSFSREDVLNMFKDSPVATMPLTSMSEKRRHVRKSDPSRPVYKKYDSMKSITLIDVDGTLMISQSESQNCFICSKFVEKHMEKMYLFDNEDQKLHRASLNRQPLKKQSTQLKIICEECLNRNFKPSNSKSPNQSLNKDEYLVIRNNQQYIFQKIKPINLTTNTQAGSFVNCGEATAIIDKIESEILKGGQEKEFVKLEIDCDGQIIEAASTNKELTPEKEASSDVELIDNTQPDIDDHVIDNLEEADEHVKEFLGKYQAVVGGSELKCRFCERVFAELNEVVDHGSEHKHTMEDGELFPCPLCDYGYANFIYLKGHLKAAHEKVKKPDQPTDDKMPDDAKPTDNEDMKPDDNDDGNDDVVLVETNETDGIKKEAVSTTSSPIATRTRSANKKSDDTSKDTSEKADKPKSPPKVESNIGENISQNGSLLIKTEVKQESLDDLEEEAIWIVQTGDDEELDERQLREILDKAKEKNENIGSTKKNSQCLNCDQVFPEPGLLAWHKCSKRRARKRKITDEPTFHTNDLMKTRKKPYKEPTSDPQIVKCHDCEESFTSKVRLKFHMQFHSPNNNARAAGEYPCGQCAPAAFRTESELFDHVHFQHDKQRRWQCRVDHCRKSFYLRANLTKHTRVHTDTRRYVCPTCGKRFLDKQTLDEHSVTHLQIKPYQCHVCMKQLTRRSRLRMHLRAHEEELRPRHVLACRLCMRAFKDREQAEEHCRSSPCAQSLEAKVKTETEVQVVSPSSGVVRTPASPRKLPPAGFAMRHQVSDRVAASMVCALAGHARALVRVVRIEKAFRCEYCEDVFYIEEGLNEHRAVHKGVKNPFICHICHVSFATYSRCTTHKTTHGYYKRPIEDAVLALKSGTKPEAGPSPAGILGYGGFPVAKHFLCEFQDCNRSYLHWTYLQVHRRMKHANDNFTYKCNACELSFPNSWSIAYHKKKVHGNSKDDQNANNVGTTKIANDYRIKCRDCEEVLPNKNSLYRHRKNNHSDLSLRINSDMYNCSQYRKRFNSGSSLEAHARVHTTLSQYDGAPRPRAPCATCARAPPAAPPCRACPRDTLQYARSHRPPPLPVSGWPCLRCDKRARSRAELRTHARAKHPHTIAVIEMEGLNPSPEEVMSTMATHNIVPDRVIDISKIAFAKGTSSIIPCNERALSLLAGLERRAAPLPCPAGQATLDDLLKIRPTPANRRPKILQRSTDPAVPDSYPTIPDLPTGYAAASEHGTGYPAVSVHGTGYPAASEHGTGYPAASEHGTGYPAASEHGTGYSAASEHGTGYPAASKHGSGYPAASEHGTGYPAASDHGTGYPAASEHGTGYPAASEHGTGYPAASKHGSGYPAASEHGTGYPAASDHGTGYPAASEHGTGYPAASEHGTGYPAASKHGSGYPAASEHGTGYPAASDHGTGYPAASEHGTGYPVASEHGTGYPAASKHGSGYPAASEHGTGYPAASDHGTGYPAASEHGTGYPAASDYGTGYPAASEHGTGYPAASVHGTGYPAASEHGTGNPAASDHGTGYPAASEHGTGYPAASEHGTGYPAASEHGTGNPAASDHGTGYPAASELGTGYTVVSELMAECPAVPERGTGYPAGSEVAAGYSLPGNVDGQEMPELNIQPLHRESATVATDNQNIQSERDDKTLLQ